MPRHPKCRRVCNEPENRFFSIGEKAETQIVTIEEVEVLRLCDLEELSQEQAALRMNVSRGTLQRILYSAHKKVALALSQGYNLEILGGNYELSQNACGSFERCKSCKHLQEA